MANGLFNLKQVNQAIQQSAWTGQKTPVVNYLVVAGGGAGGGAYGGGGGGGGFLTGVTTVTAGSAITVTVGAGGTGSSGQGPNGSNSVFGSIVATGGGGGCTGQSAGSAGGSGGGNGGGPSTAGTGTIGSAVRGQGNVGGVGGSGTGPAPGGGGGAGSVGLAGQGEGPAGSGGPGAASAITGNMTAYAGGGGSGCYNRGVGGFNSPGGSGGGGAGGDSAGNNPGTAGTANTGGGGGGGSINGSPANGGNGGSGIVVISYPDTYAAAASTTGSPTVSTSGAGSIAFNGSSQSLNYAAQTPFAFGTGDFTIEFWAYPTGGLASSPSYIDFRGSSSASPAPMIYNNNGTLSYYTAGADRITYSYATLNTWVHIAVCRSGTSTKMFVNGTQVGATYTDANSYVVGTGGPYIAQNGASGGYYTGYMSNIRIVKGVCVYTGTFTPPTAPLTITQPAGTNIAAITGTQTSLLLPANSGAFSADISSNAYAVATLTSASAAPTWNAAWPFSGTGYKNRVYTWTGNGTITF